MKPKMKIQTLVLALVMAAAPAAAQQTPKRPAPAPRQPAAKPAPMPVDEAGIESAITAALRVGYNAPGSEMSGGFLPDVEVGYRLGLGSLAIEPAIGYQRWNGDRSGTLTSPLLNEPARYEQTAVASVYEGRARLWYDLGDAGYPLLGLGLGGVSADTEQKSFGETREESNGALTWAVSLGYAYPLKPAYGNVELLLGYRGATVDFETAGNANLSGMQVLFGWHAAFPF